MENVNQSRPCVLVADDVEFSRGILKMLLRHDYEVLEASNGDEAVSQLKENAQKISCILLDIKMPGLDGYGVMDFMRQEKLIERIPVIALTSLSDPQGHIRCYESGAIDLIEKPFNQDLLLYKDDMAYLKHQAEKLLITLDRMIEIHQRKGNVDLSFSNLSPSTSYCIYCYGLSAAGERLTPITKTTVKTKAPAGLDCNFDISYNSDGIEVTMNVKPSNPDTRYYFNMLQADLTDEEVMTKVMDYLGQLVSIYEMNGYTREQAIEALTFSGESSYTFTVLEPNSEYKGFAFALSPSGITGDMTTKNVKTGEPKASDNNITVEVFDIQPRQVSVRCTPSRLGERYVVTCAPLEYYGNMPDDEVLPYLTQYLKNGNIQAVTGVFESDLTQLSPDTQYELLVVGVNGSYPSTKLFRERFTTKKEQQVDLHLTA